MSRPTQDTTAPQQSYRYGAVTLFGVSFQILPVTCRFVLWSYNPGIAVTIPVWALPFSLATTQGIDDFFLFLRVLRCFSSPGPLHL